MSTNWEAQYQSKDTPWDKGAPSPGLADYLTTHPLVGRVLVPGCGFGHDVRLLAAQGAQPVGIDIAPSAIQGAGALPKAGSERYALADLFDLPPELRDTFEWVWEHTCFCAIDPAFRSAYVEAVATALKPGGCYLAVFYLTPGGDREGPPFGVTLEELDELFGARFEMIEQWNPARTFPGREGCEWMRSLKKRSD